MLCRIFTAVTGKLLRVELAMGDADSAQWNALQEVFGGVGSSFCFLMCFFHVAKKIYEKTRAFDPIVAAMVIRHVHELHFARNDAEYQLRYGEVMEEWDKWKQLDQFKVYFKEVWLNERVRRWQCYHTPSGFATTNNPCEAYNASLKCDVTLRRKLKVGALLDQLLILCRAESVRAQPLQTCPAFDARILRRAKALTRAGCLRETRLELNTIAFLLDNNDIEDTRQIVKVLAIPATRIYDAVDKRSREDLPVTAQLGAETARMEVLDMPSSGWAVDVDARACPCRACVKYGCCVHVLYALGTVGGIDLSGRETLVYRGPNKRKRGQQVSQAAGRPRTNGPALTLE